MGLWKVKGKGWRYRFEHQGKNYSKAWYKTKAEARAAMEARRKEVKHPQTKTVMAFSELANEYLDYASRRFAIKTYKYKAFVYRKFLEFTGDLPGNAITGAIIEGYLRTRQSNTNYNRHRKDLCALLAWAWKRKFILENPCFFLEKMPEPQYIRVIPTADELHRVHCYSFF